jgi:plastocyanin
VPKEFTVRLAIGSLLASLIGLLAPLPAGAATQHVMMSGYAYSATTVTVRAGDTVTWTNHDEAPHDVVASAFRSPLLSTGQSWSMTFTAPGTYPYYCSVHPDMRAQVVVLAADPQPAAPATPAAPAATPKAPPLLRQPVTTPTTTTTTTPPATTSVAPQPEQPAQHTEAAAVVVGERLDPMLVVAGIVAAVAVLCLLLLSARPD